MSYGLTARVAIVFEQMAVDGLEMSRNLPGLDSSSMTLIRMQFQMIDCQLLPDPSFCRHFRHWQVLKRVTDDFCHRCLEPLTEIVGLE